MILRGAPDTIPLVENPLGHLSEIKIWMESKPVKKLATGYWNGQYMAKAGSRAFGGCIFGHAGARLKLQAAGEK